MFYEPYKIIQNHTNLISKSRKSKKKKVAAKKKKPTNEPKKGHFGGVLMRSARSKTKTSPFCPVFRPLAGFLFPSGTFPCLVLFSWLKTQILQSADFFRIAYMYFSPRRKKSGNILPFQKMFLPLQRQNRFFTL